MDCKEYLCENCYASHKVFKAMKDHKIITMEDILSGKVNFRKEEENRYCKVHGKLCEYYCETEKKTLCRDCVILNECPIEHSRISLKKASQIHCAELNKLLKKSTLKKCKCEKAVIKTHCVKKELEIHSQLGEEFLNKLEKDYAKQIKNMFQKFRAEIHELKVERMSALDQKETELQSTIREIESAEENTQKIIQSDSEFEIVSSHSTLSNRLQQLFKSQPIAADSNLGYIKVEAAIPMIPALGQLLKNGTPGERWKLIGQFSTGESDKLYGLALDQDDSIVLCSSVKGVKVFYHNGQVKCTIYDSPGAMDVAVSPDNKYHSIPVDYQPIKTNDSKGKELNTTPIAVVNNDLSNANSLTVDKDGKIIVGQSKNTISIHSANGSLISKFATQSLPYRLAATSNGEIVSSFYDTKLERTTSVQLMDYSGGNIRVVQPPAEIKVWSPGFVCCRQGEIFVSNEDPGDPPGVYRYTSDGDYLGCVTTEVSDPTGIAMSKNGMELFVADYDDCHVKIFQRP